MTWPFMFTMRTALTESFISPSFVPAFITTQPATVPGIPAAHSSPAREWRMAYPINVGIPTEQIRPAQDKQRNLACARLLDHQTDILTISRFNHDIRRPSDLERGVLSQRSLEGHGSPKACHCSPHICLRESRMPSRRCRDTPTSLLHCIMRWGSIGPRVQAPSSKYPPPLM